MRYECIARVTISICKTRCEWGVYVAPIADTCSMLLGCGLFDYMNMTLNSIQGLYLDGESLVILQGNVDWIPPVNF